MVLLCRILFPFRKFVLVYFNGSSLKIIKNTFYFMFKVLFVLEIITFLSWLFGYVEKWFDKKVMVNFKIYDVTDWTRNNCNYTYSPIYQGNQILKFGQLIEYNMRKIFLEKSYKQCDGETSSRPFYKKIKRISRSTVWNVIKFVFTLCPSQGLP